VRGGVYTQAPTGNQYVGQNFPTPGEQFRGVQFQTPLAMEPRILSPNQPDFYPPTQFQPPPPPTGNEYVGRNFPAPGEQFTQVPFGRPSAPEQIPLPTARPETPNEYVGRNFPGPGEQFTAPAPWGGPPVPYPNIGQLPPLGMGARSLDELRQEFGRMAPEQIPLPTARPETPNEYVGRNFPAPGEQFTQVPFGRPPVPEQIPLPTARPITPNDYVGRNFPTPAEQFPPYQPPIAAPNVPMPQARPPHAPCTPAPVPTPRPPYSNQPPSAPGQVPPPVAPPPTTPPAIATTPAATVTTPQGPVNVSVAQIAQMLMSPSYFGEQIATQAVQQLQQR